MTKIVLPKPPSINALYKYTCQGRFPHMYMTAEGKAWFEEAGWKLKSQWRNKKMITVPCELWVELFSSRMSQDNDNILKATQDLLQKGGIVKNDSLFYKVDVEKYKVKKEEERIEIEIMGY